VTLSRYRNITDDALQIRRKESVDIATEENFFPNEVIKPYKVLSALFCTLCCYSYGKHS